MSDAIKSKELLKRYSLARIPFIAINTIEHGRTLDILKETAEELQLSFFVHTSSKGVYDLVNDKVISDDKTVIIKNVTRYSNTTSKHQALIDTYDYIVTDVPKGETNLIKYM